MPRAVCSACRVCWGVCVFLSRKQNPWEWICSVFRLSAVTSQLGSIFPHSTGQSNTSSSVPATISHLHSEFGISRTEVTPCSCQHLLLLLDRGAASPVAASGNPSLGNNRPTAEPNSYFFHPNMCEWQSCSLLLGFLTPCQPSRS